MALRGQAFDRRFALILAGAAAISLVRDPLPPRPPGDHRGISGEFGTLYDLGWMLGALLLALAGLAAAATAAERAAAG